MVVHSTEEQIRELCQKLIETDEGSLKFHALADDLRNAIHQKIEDLRFLAGAGPLSPTGHS